VQARLKVWVHFVDERRRVVIEVTKTTKTTRIMWECLAGHLHKKKRIAEHCSDRAARRAEKARLMAERALEEVKNGTNGELATLENVSGLQEPVGADA